MQIRARAQRAAPLPLLPPLHRVTAKRAKARRRNRRRFLLLLFLLSGIIADVLLLSSSKRLQALVFLFELQLALFLPRKLLLSSTFGSSRRWRISWSQLRQHIFIVIPTLSFTLLSTHLSSLHKIFLLLSLSLPKKKYRLIMRP